MTLKTVEDPKSRCVRTFLRKIPHGTSCSLTLVSDHQLFAFWVIAYRRFDPEFCALFTQAKGSCNAPQSAERFQFQSYTCVEQASERQAYLRYKVETATSAP